jgi:hypothetical protein
MIRLSAPRAAAAASETHRPLTPTPEAALRHSLPLRRWASHPPASASVHVFKRSFDARKVDLLAVYIVDITLTEPAQEAVLLARHGRAIPTSSPRPTWQWQPRGPGERSA